MTDYPRDFAPDVCELCERRIMPLEKCKRFNGGGLLCTDCYQAECLPETMPASQ